MKPAIARIIHRGKATRSERGWSRGHGFYLDYEPDRPTRFDELVRKIGLSDKPMESLVKSEKLRNFAKKNRTKCFIPVILLRTWGFSEGDYE